MVELGRAADLYRAGPRRLAQGSSLEDLGRALVDHGRRAEGVDTLSAALRTYVATGATWDAGRVRRRLRALGVRRRVSGPSPREHGWAALTERERTVARLVADGLTNRMVAARLIVSPHTVNAHVRHTFTKLGVNSRVALTRIVLTSDEGERRTE